MRFCAKKTLSIQEQVRFTGFFFFPRSQDSNSIWDEAALVTPLEVCVGFTRLSGGKREEGIKATSFFLLYLNGPHTFEIDSSGVSLKKNTR